MAMPVALCLVSLGFLLIAELFDRPRLKLLAKPLASLGFVWTAIAAGATHSAFGLAVLVALVLGMAGDVFLLSGRNRWFLAGLGVFLLGHLAFAVAFVLRGVWWWAVPSSMVLLTPFGLFIAGWLWPHAKGVMRPALVAYIAAICVMVALAVGARFDGAPWSLLGAAVLFLLSDIAVARERFVKSTVLNRLWGLPAYYVAQLLFASSAGG